MFTQKILKEVLDYNPDTGICIWKQDMNRKAKKGQRAGTPGKKGRRIKFQRKQYSEARLIWFYMTGVWPTLQIDHKDRDPQNNKWLNLREASGSQNSVNRIYKKVSGLPRGVTKKGQRFAASCEKQDKKYYLGTFDSAEEASRVYQEFAIELHKDFLPK